MLRSMNDLKGFTIGATDGDIGRVDAFYFDDTSFTVRHLVVDTGGWLTGRNVLISPRALRAIDWDGKRITAELTKAQVEQSPDIDTDQPVSRQQEINSYRYYGYPAYWEGPYRWGLGPYPVMTPGGEVTDYERRWEWGAEERGDPHLRSSGAVIGYHVAATDGDIGHVEDFLVEDSSWAIRYMIVDTRNWWPGKKVLVSPEWIEGVDWSDSTVRVGVTREQIEKSPEYDPRSSLARDYEAQLHSHYGRSSYWEPRAATTTAGEWTARPDRPVAAPLLHVRFSEQLERLKQEPTWRTSRRNAITLNQEPALRLVLMLLGKGIKITEHQAAGPLTLQVLSGSMALRSGARTVEIGAGELIALESAIEHDVEALEESACLLTLAGAR